MTNHNTPGLDHWPRHMTGPTLPTDVSGQARDAATVARGGHISGAPVLATLATLLLLPFTAQAQIIPTGTPAADILLSRALADQQVFLTCSSLDPETHAAIRQGWQAEVDAAASILAANAVAPQAITAFTSAALPDSLMQAPDMPFSEVRQFCDGQPDWPARWQAQGGARLSETLPRAFP